MGIPTVKDRIVQMAVLLVLEPIFEADFLDSSYGFRPGRNAHQAIDAIRQHLAAELREIYDADLKFVLRHDPPRCLDQVSGATDRRPLGADADPHVLGLSHSRDRRAGTNWPSHSAPAGSPSRG